MRFLLGSDLSGLMFFFHPGVAIHNFRRRHSASKLPSHVEPTLSLTDSHFFLGLAISITTTILIFAFIIYSICFAKLEPWMSWSQVHLHFYDINIVQAQRDITNIEVYWWMVPVISIIYVLPSIVFGGEAKEFLKACRKPRCRSDSGAILLPMQYVILEKKNNTKHVFTK